MKVCICTTTIVKKISGKIGEVVTQKNKKSDLKENSKTLPNLNSLGLPFLNLPTFCARNLHSFLSPADL